MREFQQKRNTRRKIYSKTTAVILFFLIILVGRGTWNIYQKYQESSQNADRVSVELAKLQGRQADLQKSLSHLDTDEGVEEEIRQKFQVSKDGEKVFVIVDSTSSASTTEEKAGFFGNIWNDIKNIF